MAAAKMALRGLEDEYACSQLYLEQVKRFIHLVKEQVPHKNRLEGTVRGLIQQLVGLRARKAQLVSWFEDPDRVGRLRLLGGVDPSQSELWVILGKLEKRLSIKEEDLSEKNLIYEAVCRLVDALRVKTDASRSDTLLLALQVNGVQSKLFQLRRKMETRFAELIISNSERDRLIKKVSQLEKNLDICTIRSLSGMPPNKQIAREYELEARRKKVRDDYKREKLRSPRKGSSLESSFLIIYINDYIEDLGCGAIKFADDLKLQRAIKSDADRRALQESPNRLSSWSARWRLKFNSSKCVVLRIRTRRTSEEDDCSNTLSRAATFKCQRTERPWSSNQLFTQTILTVTKCI
ncbi:unnamed protein product [Schistocephalus solidus]|uniref:RPW8 domain-containing protein n=1 Tax=Schistocephalus solidus TaxID=70667 RepID=A0A183TH40_SCHSO|nr:unnamed protein product [Schistocephalus solidus]